MSQVFSELTIDVTIDPGAGVIGMNDARTGRCGGA
jgi:hypothetical protein